MSSLWQQRCLPDLFAAQAAVTPAAPAITFQGQTLTYQDLNARANQLAHALQQFGVGPEQVVAIFLEHGKAVL